MNELDKDYQIKKELTMRQINDFIEKYPHKDMADVGGFGYEDRLSLLGLKPDVYDLLTNDHDICTSVLPKTYQTIICCNTFEHIIDPYGAAQNIIKSLKPGGYLFLTTVWRYPFHAYGDVIDTYRYTDQALKALFEKLEEVSCWYEDEYHPEGAIRISYIGRKHDTIESR